MSHTDKAIAKGRFSASLKKQKERRENGDGRKTPANRFNDLPVAQRRCPLNQPVTASQKTKLDNITFTCPCGHKTVMRLDGINGTPDGFADHCDTHPDRESL